MLLGSAPFSLVGVALSTWLSHRYGDGFEDAAGIILGIALIAGHRLRGEDVLTGRAKSDSPFLLQRSDRWIAFLLGVAGGFVVGLTSVGSGTFFGLVMLLVFPLTAAKVVGTDIFHAAALLGRGRRPSRRGQRRPRGDRLAADRLDPRRAARQPGLGQPSSGRCGWGSRRRSLAGLKLAEVPGAEVVILAVLCVVAVALLTARRPEGAQRLNEAGAGRDRSGHDSTLSREPSVEWRATDGRWRRPSISPIASVAANSASSQTTRTRRHHNQREDPDHGLVEGARASTTGMFR